jgi:hypothetical protein
MSNNIDELRSKLRAKIFGTRFSRLPKGAKEVRIENATTLMEQTIAKMKESVKQ